MGLAELCNARSPLGVLPSRTCKHIIIAPLGRGEKKLLHYKTECVMSLQGSQTPGTLTQKAVEMELKRPDTQALLRFSQSLGIPQGEAPRVMPCLG